MDLMVKKLHEINNWMDIIKGSECGSIFQYDWYLKTKKVENVLCVLDKGRMVAVMALFAKEGEQKLNQSTIYVPYGGPVFVENSMNCRKKLIYKRKIINEICIYLKQMFQEIHFSTDIMLTDIIPFIKQGFIPEFRFTYIMDLEDTEQCNPSIWSRNRIRDLRKAEEADLKYFLDYKFDFFDFEKSVKWDKEYVNKPVETAENVMRAACINGNGVPFIAMKDGVPIGAIFVAWDHRKAYLLYSYYNTYRSEEYGVLTYLYKTIFDYTKNVLNLNEIDFEGSVLERVEHWNISFAAKQKTYFNLHWCENVEKLQISFYDYE